MSEGMWTVLEGLWCIAFLILSYELGIRHGRRQVRGAK